MIAAVIRWSARNVVLVGIATILVGDIRLVKFCRCGNGINILGLPLQMFAECF